MARPYETAKIAEALRDADRRLGELLPVASYTGLRRGELIALRWRAVRWPERVLVVERALCATVERTTERRRMRYVATSPPATAPRSRPLRFRDLRHTAGTLLTRVLDPVTAKDVLGHADRKTTERYLHAVRASRLADATTRAFTPHGTTERFDADSAAIRAAWPR